MSPRAKTAISTSSPTSPEGLWASSATCFIRFRIPSFVPDLSLSRVPVASDTSEPSIAANTYSKYHGPATWFIYAKGSLVQHMLRGVLGYALFKKGLAAYFSTFRGRAARVADFQATMERVSGQSLGWFFDEWIDTKVLPDYTITRVTSLPTPDGAFQTTATVRNLGTGQMPVEVGFVMDGGDLQIQKAEIPSSGEVMVTATTQKPVKQVEVDPKKWVIQKDYKNDVAPVR